MTRTIRDVNEELLGLTNRASQFDRAINDETRTAEAVASRQIGLLYTELGIILPDQVAKRFDDVVAFHKSVVHNRTQFLAAEREDVAQRINELSETRSQLDQERARVMEVLQASVVFETFVNAQSRLAELDSLITDLNRRLESAASIGTMSTKINAAKVDAERQIRQELRDRENFLVHGPLALFRELGDEIYADRTADLLVSIGKNGAIKVTPQISGDASTELEVSKRFF